jgi:nucleotide-binding universal stress UspA family protein
MSEQQEPGRRIVVGVDGSPSSKAALAWAVRQAELTGASVEAVIAWHYPAMVGGVPFAPIEAVYTADYAEFAAKVLNGSVCVAVDPDGAVKVSSTVREGNAAQVLLDASEGADLLVVGSRGHGGFTEALLGSVSQACVHHARCPVVIIREPARRRPTDSEQSREQEPDRDGDLQHAEQPANQRLGQP